MEGQGFLERVRGKGGSAHGGEPTQGTVGAVREHLCLLLNTRRGTVGHLPDYGIPDLAGVYAGLPASLETLRHAIKATIDKYEPRMQRVRVKLQETDLPVSHATFLIIGEVLEEEGNAVKVSFRTTIADSGRTELDG
jgi:type VI secretion system protein